MKLRVFNILRQTKVEGPGVRYCIWTQGCSRHCRGCQAVHTWSHSGGVLKDVNQIINDIFLIKDSIEGITFLGGEPFEQAEAVGFIASEVKKMGLSVLCFTGYLLEELIHNDRYKLLLDNTDLLIDGEFREDEIDYSRPWVGSKNQRYHFLTSRYDENVLKKYKNRVEINISESGVVFVNGMGNFDEILQKIDLVKINK